jgi:hypothetical protein
MAQVFACHSGEFVALCPIYRRFRRFDFSGGSSLYLDEAKYILVPTDQVDLSATTARAEVSRHYDVPQAAKKEVNLLLSPAACLLMAGSIVRHAKMR